MSLAVRLLEFEIKPPNKKKKTKTELIENQIRVIVLQEEFIHIGDTVEILPLKSSQSYSEKVQITFTFYMEKDVRHRNPRSK